MLPKDANFLLILFLEFMLPFLGRSEERAVHDLNIMLIVSFGQFGFNSSGVIPAADIALEDINRDPDVLPGYRLVYDRVRDSKVSLPSQLSIKFTEYS